MELGTIYIVSIILIGVIMFFTGVAMGKLLSIRANNKTKPEPVRDPWGWGMINIIGDGIVEATILEMTRATYKISFVHPKFPEQEQVGYIPKSSAGFIGGHYIRMEEVHSYNWPAETKTAPLQEPKKVSINEFLSTVVEHEKEVGTYTEAIIDPERFRAPKFKA